MSGAGPILCGDPAERTLLADGGFDDLDRLFERFLPPVTRHEGRHVAEATLANGDRVFIKLQSKRPRLIPTMRELRDGRFLRSQPENEWRGLSLLRAAGLHAAQPVALFRSGWRNFRAAIIIRAVPPPHSIHDLLQDGSWQAMDEASRHALASAIAAVPGAIHRARLAWAGIASKHLFPERLPDGSWRIWLIDCEGVHRDPSGRSRTRDHRKLHTSLTRSGADEEMLGLLKAAAAVR